MKCHLKKLLIVYLLIFVVVIPAQSQAKDAVIKDPPASLNKFYPPVNAELKYTKHMFKMGNHFSGISVDMKENDWENAEKHARELVKAYEESLKMVEEWKDYFNMDAARNLAKVVGTKDKKQIKKASDELLKSCDKCHNENRIAVWTRYHWASFDKIVIMHPITENDMEYDDYMWDIEEKFRAVIVNINEGQYRKAGKALKKFKNVYMELKATCKKCHVADVVKKIFVGQNISDAIKNIKDELKASNPDKYNFDKNIEVIRKEGCKMCHLTHFNASIVKRIWKEKK